MLGNVKYDLAGVIASSVYRNCRIAPEQSQPIACNEIRVNAKIRSGNTPKQSHSFHIVCKLMSRVMFHKTSFSGLTAIVVRAKVNDFRSASIPIRVKSKKLHFPFIDFLFRLPKRA